MRVLLAPRARDLLRRLYPQYEIAKLTISLPWPRTFEMETDLRRVPRT
jgi:hypothetical protein